jgi:hypothetical protein
MTTSQISGLHGGIVLSPDVYSNPVTVTSTGVISGGNDSDHALSAIYSWTILNYGSISSSRRQSVYLTGGGAITNEASGIIDGVIYFQGRTSTVVNFGSIIADVAVYLGAGGAVTNAASGWIGGEIENAGFVDNAGTIVSNERAGIVLGFGGSVVNRPGGAISGEQFGVEIGGELATLNNYGVINGYRGAYFYAKNAVVINSSAGVINGRNDGVNLRYSGTIDNYGQIVGGTAYAYGVDLTVGRVVNSKHGVITGGKMASWSTSMVQLKTPVRSGASMQCTFLEMVQTA